MFLILLSISWKFSLLEIKGALSPVVDSRQVHVCAGKTSGWRRAEGAYSTAIFVLVFKCKLTRWCSSWSESQESVRAFAG